MEGMVQDHNKILSDNSILNAKNQPKTVLKTSSGNPDITATSLGADLPTSCNDLSINGHSLNCIYLLFDFDFQKILPTYGDFMSSGKLLISFVLSPAIIVHHGHDYFCI